MKEFNLSKGTLYFPLKEGEEVINGAIYEVVDGKAQRVTSSTITGTVIGVSAGGNRVKKGYIMLDIDPTAVYSQPYTETAPTIGTLIDGCKLVVGVNAEDGRFTYLLRLPTSGGGYVLPIAQPSFYENPRLGGVIVGDGLLIDGETGIMETSGVRINDIGEGLNLEGGVLSATGGSGVQAIVTLPINPGEEAPITGEPYYIYGTEGYYYQSIGDYVAINVSDVIGKCISTDDTTATFLIDDSQVYELPYSPVAGTPVVGQKYNGHFIVTELVDGPGFKGVIYRQEAPVEKPLLVIQKATDYTNPQYSDAVLIANGIATKVADNAEIPVNAVVGIVIGILDEDMINVKIDADFIGSKEVGGQTVGTIVNGHELVISAGDFNYSYTIVKTGAIPAHNPDSE